MQSIKLILGATIIAAATPLFAGSLVDGYNVLIFNSFNANNSDSNVPVAIAGNATTSNYSFDQSTNSAVSGGYGTVVGGNLTMTGGNGPSPTTYVAGSATLTNTSCNTGCIQTSGTSPVNFNLLQTQMLNESWYLAEMATNGAVALQNGGLVFSAATPNQSLYIFSIDASELTAGYTYLDFVGTGNAAVVVNVTGSIPDGSSIVNGGFQGTNGSNVLFNFYNASQITVSSFNASLLAPFATVYGNPGQFDGTLVAENFMGGISADEFHANDTFTGTLPTDPNLNDPPPGSIPTPAPEPGAAYLLAGGILVVVSLIRFGRGKSESPK
jgi:choice-of-anchor A domain-containing protein